MLKIVEKTKLWFTISIVIILAGLICIGVKGLNFGIDFKGGTIVQINMEKDFNKEEVDEIITKYDKDAITKKVDETQIEISSRDLENEDIDKMFKEVKEKYALKSDNPVKQDTIGASIGKELKQKALISLTIATLAMLVYVGIRFEFKFGAAAIIALLHDVLITLSVFAFFQIPLNSSFIAAVLTIVGYSINDTIVVFDRIRENGKKNRRMPIEELTNKSITETMARSINTSLTTLFTIVAVYVFVPSVRDFAFPLIIGIVSGAYSSIFIASPLWVVFKNKLGKKSGKVVA